MYLFIYLFIGLFSKFSVGFSVQVIHKCSKNKLFLIVMFHSLILLSVYASAAHNVALDIMLLSCSRTCVLL